MKLFLTAILALALCAPAVADDTPRIWAEVLPWAQHYGTQNSPFVFNSALRGGALFVPLDPSGDLQLGCLAYQNSFYIPTQICGFSYTPLRWGSLHIGGVVGVSNYNAYPANPIRPIVAGAEVLIDLNRSGRTRADLLFQPCGGQWCTFALAVGLRQGFGRR